MPSEENQNLGNKTAGEKPIPAELEPELEAVEPVAEVAEVAENDGQTENLAEPIADSPAPAEIEKSAEIAEPTTEPTIIKTAEGEKKQSQPTEPQEQKVEEIPQAGNLPPVEIQEVENAKAQTPAQKILAQPQTKIVEKIKKKITPQGRTSSVVPLRSTSPRGTTFSRDFIQKLLVKARAKIQERKRKKLDKIMSLFETKTELSNSDVRKL